MVKRTATPRATPLSKKASIMVFSKGATIASQLGAIVLLTRLLTKETFGLLSFLLLAYATVTSLAQLGLPESIFYFFERVSKKSRKNLALVTSKTLFLIGLAASLILVLLSYAAPSFGFEVGGLFLPLIALVLLELPTLPLPNILIAVDKAKSAAWFNIVSGLLQFGSLVVPTVLGLPLESIVTCLLFYGFGRFAIAAWLFLSNFRETGEALPAGIVKEQFRYSIPLGLSQLLWGLNRQIDKYVVAFFLPVTVYAEYVVGAWEIPFLPAIAYSVASVMMPKMVSLNIEGSTSQLLDLWNASIRKVTVIVLPMVVLFLTVAEEFIVLLFSENYLAAAVPFRIYTLIILQRVAAYSSMLKAVGETKVITYSAVYMVLINLVLSVPFVIWLGLVGAPLATLVANIFTWGYALRKISRALKVRVREVFPFGFYLKALLVAGFTGLGIWVLKDYWQVAAQIKLFFICVVFLLAYALAGNFSKLISKEDWRFFARSVGIGSAG